MRKDKTIKRNMNELIKALNKRVALLERSIKLAEKEEKTLPDGRLRVSRKRYYKITANSDEGGEYLLKKNMPMIRKLAQRDYNRVFMKAAGDELKMLKKFILGYNNPADDIYNNLISERKNLVTPYIVTDDLIAKEWQSKTFKQSTYKPENKIFSTRRGEKVRSKSEAIIADTLYEFGIPYRYESSVIMIDGSVRYPDFTLFNVKKRDVIYFEHFGRMHEEGYRKDAMEKMDLYRASGIYPGKNLIFTYETKEKPLDINGMRKMLYELFCEAAD
jgi:hypothetical protein